MLMQVGKIMTFYHDFCELKMGRKGQTSTHNNKNLLFIFEFILLARNEKALEKPV